jgi:quercetin dioxygenase-like cupin family protein
MRTVDPKALIPALALVSGLVLQAHTVEAGNQLELPHAFEAGWEGQKTCELLFEDNTVRVGRCVFPPGIGHEKHYHNPHFGYVLESGTMRVTDSKGEHEVTTKFGTSWSTMEVTVHQALNTGETTTSYLIVEPTGQ